MAGSSENKHLNNRGFTGNMPGNILHPTDKGIIEELTRNARIPLLHIAQKLSLSESAIRKRLKNLEELGVIRQYSLVVDHAKVGYNNMALVGVDVQPDKYLEVSNALKGMGKVKYAASTMGDHMFMLEVLARDHDELRDVCDSIKRIPGVTRICPAIIKDTIKGTL
jgi:Lrp/AsnC family transcriptional regulator, regulator for asnA, asnC and gidA